MCYRHVHLCDYCGNEYECKAPDYICPTINNDEDRNMCEPCHDKEARAFAKWIEENPDAPLPKLREWEPDKDDN